MADEPQNSPKHESLDEIVSHSAAIVAEQIQKAAAWAGSEMDLQIEVAGALKEFARRAQVTIEGHHNITIATGRPDSVYGSVIVEYKEPGVLSPNRDAAGNKKVIEQLKQRFYDFRREEGRKWNTMFGVGTDGKYFIFLRFRDEKWTDQEPLPVDRYSTERFLWALYNLGQKGKPYQPEYLHGDFGSDSVIAQEGVRTLYEEIRKTDNPKAQVFFNQWKILFGEVCGYDVENLSDKVKKLAQFYGVTGSPEAAPLLFAVHTYYAVLIKLLAAEIVSFFNPWMPRQIEKLLNATTSIRLKRELEELERGGIFYQMGITNFLEGDLFSWYLSIWNEPIEGVVRRMMTKLDEYNPGTFSEDPVQSRDLLKKLYQQLFPKSVRHDLGEYYTPDWLAEHVLNALGYEGDPDKRILDPACGSGTFLVMIINRIRRWYDRNREKLSYDEGDLLKKILANVIGFDLNPLAVMAARTNYLVAIKDLVRHVDGVEIPVYLCDSIMTPAEHGNLFTGSLGSVARVPCSAMKPPYLLVPNEIAQRPEDVARYAHILEECVRQGYKSEEFLNRCSDEGLKITATDAHLSLYKELVRLDKENKNGIWARIIKNNFAPLFVGKVDYVAGNPPWINWESLPADYRQATKPVWENYGLFTLTGHAARLGGGKKDLAMLFVYVSVDQYLGLSGKLGFVITQSVFKTKGAGDGFRRFAFDRDNKHSVLTPVVVDDLSRIQVFEGATNRTAVFVCKKATKPFNYPVKYIQWSGPSRIMQDEHLASVMKNTQRQELYAVPIDTQKPTSPWLTVAGTALEGIKKVLGKSAYKAWEGANSGGLNGVYWVRVLQRMPDGNMLIENLWDIGKIKVESVYKTVEPGLVHPLLRGRDVERWKTSPSASIILAQDPQTRVGILEPDMKRDYPHTYAYLRHFEAQLRKRSGYRQYFESTDPFWSMYNIGPYTMAKAKVVWREQSSELQAAVVGSDGDKAVIPDHKLMMVECQTSEEAHYLAAMLGSSPCKLAVRSYVLSTSTSTHLLGHIAIPSFSPEDPLHRRLSDLSHQCHAAAAADLVTELQRLEEKVSLAAAELWGISKAELRAIQEALSPEDASEPEETSENEE
jgi:SAM-dependent methyltransferase